MAVGLTHCDPKRHAAKAADDIPESIFEDWLALGLLCNGNPDASEGTPSSGPHAMIETVHSLANMLLDQFLMSIRLAQVVKTSYPRDVSYVAHPSQPRDQSTNPPVNIGGGSSAGATVARTGVVLALTAHSTVCAAAEGRLSASASLTPPPTRYFGSGVLDIDNAERDLEAGPPLNSDLDGSPYV